MKAKSNETPKPPAKPPENKSSGELSDDVLDKVSGGATSRKEQEQPGNEMAH